MRVGAPVYVPLAQRQVEPMVEPAAAAETHQTSLLDIDWNVLRDNIIGRLSDIRDVIACIISCRVLRNQAVAARFSNSLDLRSCSDSHAPASSSIAINSLMIKSLVKYTPCVTSLDASNLPLDSYDVDAILSRLPLQKVSFSGCKQLNNKSALFSGNPPLRPPNLLELDLQRCFATAGCLLLTSNGKWNLQCLCLSHLFFLPRGTLTGTTPTLKMLALNNCTQMDLEGLLFITRAAPNLTHFCLGGSTFSSDCLRQQQHPDSDEETLLKGSHPIAQILYSVAISLPLLEVLELTFTGSDIITLVENAIGPRVQVLDLSTSRGVSYAAQCLRDDHDSRLSKMIQCAAKCKSSSRKSITPLHLAAHAGDLNMAMDLIRLGALIDARDASGAVPIFVACEQGQTDIVRTLLALAADFTISNSDGESCLYISALKGHLGCVEALLSASRSRWYEHQYSDGWSPLHAACIGWSGSHQKHLTIARLLIDSASSPDELYKMLSASNRYGQTVIHLAARKSSVLLELFFSRGEGLGGDSLFKLFTQNDKNRCTPLDVAVKNNNTKAIEILQHIIF